MRKFTLIALYLLLMNTISAQDWPPNEAKWHYSYDNFWVFGYIEMQTVSDTLINEYTFKKLEKIRYTYDASLEEYDTVFIGVEFIRSDADHVYIFRNGQIYTLYDFSVEVGDTWQIPMTYDMVEFDTVGTVIVTAKGDTVISAQQLRYFIVEPTESSDWALNGTVIERVGAVSGYFLPEQNTDWVDIFEGGSFRCYSDDNLNLEQGNNPCTYITSVYNQQMIDKELQIYPNPAKDYIIFQLPAYTTEGIIKIVDIYGNLVQELVPKSDKVQWNFQDINTGMYFYRAEIEGTTYRGKIIVQ